jgi:hypothetical protein
MVTDAENERKFEKKNKDDRSTVPLLQLFSART